MSTRTKCLRHWKLQAMAAFVAASQLVVPSAALAQVPSASTVIQSRASASYVDFDGVTQVATSNVVQTTVQQVGAFTVSAAVTKSAAPGAPVAVMHTITNTGNGADIFKIQVQDKQTSGNAFTRIDVFADADANGLADSTTSLLTGGAVTGGAMGTSQDIPIAAGESYHYVVLYTLPTTAPLGWNNKASVNAIAGNAAISYAAQNLSVDDTIQRAPSAAFSTTLTHSAPLVAAAGGGSWGATPSSGAQGTTTTYTLTYTNNGADAGQIYLRDVLPTGLTYVAGSAVWSSNPGVALTEAGAFGGSSPTDQIALKVTGQTIEAMVKAVPAGASGTLSFKATVAASAPFGNLVSQGLFSAESCAAADLAAAASGTGCGAAGTSPVSATFTVLPARGVMVGPLQDSTPGTPASALDTVTMTQVVAGGSVKFSIPVKNTGNASDTFKLSLNQTGMTFPAGTLFTWFYADGLTPLQNTVGGTDVDTGPVAAGDTINVVLRASVPSSTPVANNVNLTVKAVANSFIDATKIDAVNLTVTNVVADLVDLTSTSAGVAGVDIGPGALFNAVSQNLTVTAGSAGYTSSEAANAAAGSAVYDLYVSNYDSAPLTFALESSLTTTFPGNPPAGWTVKYYAFNTNVATSVTGSAITQVAVANGAKVRVLAVVTPLSTSSDVSALSVYFRVRSTSVSTLGGSIVTDFVRTQINVTAPSTRGFILSPSGSKRQVAPSAVADFPHVLLNNGTVTCGPSTGLKITATLSPAPTGVDDWKVVIYQDNGTVLGQIDTNDTLLTGNMLPPLAPGASLPLIVRVYSPSSSAPGGSNVNVTLTVADETGAPNCGTQSLTNSVNVTIGQLEVSKLQILDGNCNSTSEATTPQLIAAKPGDCIVYRSILRNNGSSPVTNAALQDVIPPFTSYHGTQPTVQCESSGLTPAATTIVHTGGSLSCTSTGNTLMPGGTLTLRYRVKVNTN